MAALSEETKRDIANKFSLPERRSKIASLLKQNDEVYCICRTTDSTRLMIACDNCDEWYHVDCVSLTKQDSSAIKVYYCPICISTNPNLKTIYKDKRRNSKTEKPKPTKRQTQLKTKKCSCSGCLRMRNCGKCTSCVKHNPGVKCIARRCTAKKIKLSDDEFQSKSTSESSESDSEEEEEVKVTKKVKGKEIKKKPPPARKNVVKSGGGGVKRGATRRRAQIPVKQKPIKESSSEDETISYGRAPRQCYGPECTEKARQNSKYCGDLCGLRRAHTRIYAILPARLTEWNMSGCVASDHNQIELEEIKKKYIEATEEIKLLLDDRYELDKHLSHVNEVELNSGSSDEEHDDEGTIYCVSCGHEISMKTCIKHMEKCFNKYEGKTTFGSIYKQSQIEGPPLFCDSYNLTNKTYCKRLAVLCAEHVKQPKLGDKELCGYPVNELTNKKNPFGKYCRVRKKKCNRHFAWEKLRKASIDMQRVRMYLRLDELLDKDAKIRSAEKYRGGMMNLLLNSTFNHEVMKESYSQIEEEEEVEVEEEDSN